jgi:hypothetical protein
MSALDKLSLLRYVTITGRGGKWKLVAQGQHGQKDIRIHAEGFANLMRKLTDEVGKVFKK